jgi:multimeric flavodoxin WrbA
MKRILLFNGSPHREGNTAIALGKVAEVLNVRGIETQMIQLGGTSIKPCMGCRKCIELKNGQCVIQSDAVNGYIEALVEADGMIIGSPVYTSNVTAEVKAFIDRVNFVCKVNDFMLKGKVGAPVIVATKTGANVAYAAIQYMFGISQMIMVGSSYWNVAYGKLPGDILQDGEGIQSFIDLGENIADLLVGKEG